MQRIFIAEDDEKYVGMGSFLKNTDMNVRHA
jgi:hypothetical protein